MGERGGAAKRGRRAQAGGWGSPRAAGTKAPHPPPACARQAYILAYNTLFLFTATCAAYGMVRGPRVHCWRVTRSRAGGDAQRGSSPPSHPRLTADGCCGLAPRRERP